MIQQEGHIFTLHRFRLLLFLVVTFGGFGQTSFEVASVKSNRSGSPQSRTMMNRTFVAENLSLRAIICLAYDVLDLQLRGGPSWTGSERWDVAAKPETALPNTPAGDAMMRTMVQALLRDRFHLSTHTEIREVPAYALMALPAGHKLAPADQDGFGGDSWGRTLIRGRRMSAKRLARLLSIQLEEMVSDQTGISGEFNIQLEFAPISLDTGDGGAANAEKPSLFAAVQALGLRLERRRVPVETLVIDSVQRPEDN